MPGPYASLAHDYWKRSWRNPIPVKGKSHPISGYTGYEGRDVSWTDLEGWVKTQGHLNVGIRALSWVGIDVDDYGDKHGAEALKAAENELGPLPATYSSTSRGPDQPARILFFQVPWDVDLARSEKRLNDRFGEDVDIIHRTFRYAVVAPSVHPDTGQPYRWYGPDGQEVPEVPDRTKLPQLPEAWLTFLATPTVTAASTAPGAGEDFWDAADRGSWSRASAEKAIAAKLDEVRAMDASSKVNEVLGGAARFLGRFVPALLTQEQAEARLVEAVDANEWHSDSWNVANRKDWTSRTVIGTALANGAAEPFEVEAEPVKVELPSAGPGRRNEPGPARELPPPGMPMDVARELVDSYPADLTWWRGDFYSHEGTHWITQEEAVIRGWVRLVTERATYLVAIKDKDGGKPKFEAKNWAPTIPKVREVVMALGEGVLQRTGDDDRVLALANGVLDLAGRTLAPHSPEIFNLTSRPFPYVAGAAAPHWDKFLEEVLPSAPDDQRFLQEWFGYVLSGRTDIHAIASLAGASRSGKGTILRVLTAMTGTENVAAGRLDVLAGQFGLEGLIGKSLLAFGDVRWNNSNAQVAIQQILEISGEDKVTVPRKNKTDWQGTLGVRVMFAGNEIPRFSDPSRAMANRLRIVHFTQSFAGREDHGLTARLLGELPGIFNWALEGLDRLTASGRFTESARSVQLRERVGEGGDATSAFADEYLEVDEESWCFEDDLMDAYTEWCTRTRRLRDSSTAETLRSAVLDMFPKVTNDKSTRRTKRTERGPRKVRTFAGLKLSAVVTPADFYDE
jgi:putative DNA primase/helicase